MRLLNKRQLMLVMDVRGGIFIMRLSNVLDKKRRNEFLITKSHVTNIVSIYFIVENK